MIHRKKVLQTKVGKFDYLPYRDVDLGRIRGRRLEMSYVRTLREKAKPTFKGYFGCLAFPYCESTVEKDGMVCSIHWLTLARKMQVELSAAVFYRKVVGESSYRKTKFWVRDFLHARGFKMKERQRQIDEYSVVKEPQT